ncbi:MAG: glycosyltransferase [Alphaproteobacteria bacterium]|nr:MAG: glycosyltransferase [Alphaproteobacteria bacterium]
METTDGTLFAQDGRPLVAIFRSPVFNASETFVRTQAAGLERYQPLLIGLEDKGHVPEALANRIMMAHGAGERFMVRLGYWGRLGERAAAAKPVLVHAHFGTDGVLALPLARRLGVPLVTTLRGFEMSRRRLLTSGRLSWMRYALGRSRLMREGALFLTVSASLRERALLQGFPVDRTHVHYNGVDLVRFGARREDDGETVLHVGRLVEKKGTAILLRAFAKVRSGTLVIIGEGPLRTGLERLSRDLGLVGRVHFLGSQPPEAVARWMRRAALLAAPSLTAPNGDCEGLPNVVVEAAAAALPVIGSAHAGIPEAVSDGETGFIVPEGAEEPLTARMTTLLGDAALRGRMGAAGRALARERFDLVQQTRRLERRYEELTSISARATR